jgi:hypothetical protein
MMSKLKRVSMAKRTFAHEVAQRMLYPYEQFEMLMPTSTAVFPLKCRRCGKVETVTLLMIVVAPIEDVLEMAKRNHRCEPKT